MTDLAAIKERHVMGTPRCKHDGQTWPCDAAQLLVLLADTPSVEPAGLREAVLEALELGGTESLLRRVRAVLDVNAGEDGLGYQEAGRLAAIWTRDHAIAHVRAALAALPTRASEGKCFSCGTPDHFAGDRTHPCIPTQASDSPEKP